MELRSVDDAMGTGPVAEWICSGVPTDLPVPDEDTAGLLRDRGLFLFPDGPSVPAARTRCRRPIGYATRDHDVLRLALLIAQDARDARDVEGERTHAMVLAARCLKAGYSVKTAAGWVTAGISRPEVSRPEVSRPGVG